MKKPIIGITPSRTKNKGGYYTISLMEAYITAVSNAGGIPLPLPLNDPEETVEVLLPHLDGVLFTGGGDIDPKFYNGNDDDTLDSMDIIRDKFELALCQVASSTKKPFFGICRGIQLINVALGGTLYEDILKQMPGGQKHSFSNEQPRNYLAHKVTVNEDSCLFRILGTSNPGVNSLHHQGIRTLAPGLRPTAYAPDGLVEGIEIPGHPFALAVQWHPEWLQEHAPMRSLFKAFVDAASFHK